MYIYLHLCTNAECNFLNIYHSKKYLGEVPQSKVKHTFYAQYAFFLSFSFF